MTVHNEYGKALFILTEELGTTELVLSDVKTAKKALDSSPEYVKLLDTPALTKAERLSLIDKAFAALDENLRNLIKILCERHSVSTFSDVATTYLSLYDASRGIEHVEAVTAVKMTEAQLERMRKKLADMTGKTIMIKNKVDPDILGGVKLRYSGKQLDGSVRTRLDRFEESLKNTII